MPKCPEHRCHPDECFYIHYPEARSGRRAPTESELRNEIIRTHVEKQKKLIREQRSKRIVDAVDKFEERRKGA